MRKEIVLFVSFFLIGVACAQNIPIAQIPPGPAVLEISINDSTSNTSIFNVSFVVKNIGGESAYQLYVYSVPSDKLISEEETIDVLSPRAVLKDNISIAVNETNHFGTYSGVLVAEYSKRDFRFFSEPDEYFSSTIRPFFLHYKKKTEARVKSTNFSVGMRSGEQAKVSVDIENFDNVSHTVDVYLILPGELKNDAKFRLDIPENSKKSIEFYVHDAGALPGKTYDAFLILDYESEGVHYSSIGYGKIRVYRFMSFSIFFILAIGVCVAGLILTKKLQNDVFVDVVILLGIYLFLLHFFDPSKFFDTTPPVWDTPSHYLTADYLKNYLIPHGRTYGWMQGWFAGFPVLEFYFPLPFLLSSALGNFFPMTIAFKIVMVLGGFLLPIVTFFFMKLLKFDFPVPSFGAILSLLFLFNEKGVLYGGSVLSSAIGEFSYGISFSLMILFLGVLYKNISEKKFSIITSFLFSLVMLSHIVTGVVGVISSVGLIFLSNIKDWRNIFRILAGTFLLSFLLIAFHVVPILSTMSFTTSIARFELPREIFPLESIIIFPLALHGIISGIKSEDRRIKFLLFWLIISIVLFFVGYKIILVTSMRFWPIVYFVFGLLAAYGAGNLLNSVYKKRGVCSIALIILLCVFLFIFLKNTTSKYWIEWNLAGLENKNAGSDLFGITSFFAELEDNARVVYEPSSLHNRFGSAHIFQLLPYLTKKNVLEGIYVEGTPTSPFIIFTENEISEICYARMGRDVWCVFDLDSATKHLELFNARYILAVSKKLKENLRKRTDWGLLKKVGIYEIYGRIGGKRGYVTVPEYEPIFMKTNDWKAVSFDWFKNNEKVPIIFSDSKPESGIPGTETRGENCTINEAIQEEEVIFDTNCIGKPHLVKISYHPNWQVEGADRVYLSTPSFMMVYPKQSHVRLFFGRSTADYAGYFLTGIGVLFVFLNILSTKLNPSNFNKR